MADEGKIWDLKEKDRVLEIRLANSDDLCSVKGPMPKDDFNKEVPNEFACENFGMPSYEVIQDKGEEGRDLRMIRWCVRTRPVADPAGLLDPVEMRSCAGCKYYNRK